MTLVNNHVLFSIMADRKVQPEWSRTGQTEIAGASAESRSSLRAQPLVRLAFLITPKTLAEQIELNECVMAARKSGLACAPYHGRTSQLQNAAVAATSIEVNNNFAWAIGDWIFLRDADGDVVTRQLTDATLDAGVWTLEFAGALTADDGAMVWPLLFGEFNCESMEAQSPKNGPLQVSITELVSARSVQLGEVSPPGGSGIGVWAIGSTFVVQ